MKLYLIILLAIFHPYNLFAGWFCEEAASEKNDNIIMTCGIGSGDKEEEARDKALQSAFKELDAICERSIDCKTFETLIEPQRNDCRKEKKGFKCVRAVKVVITKTKRKKPYDRVEEEKAGLQKMEVIVKIDPKDLIVINNGQVEDKKKCMHDLSGLSQALMDISSQDKLEKMLGLALQVPVDMLCFPIHAKIMYLFERYGIRHQDYQNFLIKTLDDLADTTGDERAYIILEHWMKTGPMDESQWASAHAAVLRGQKNGLYRLMPRLVFHEVPSNKDQKREEERIDTLAKSALDGKLGKPMPMSFEEAMELFLRSFKHYRSKDNPWAALYVYRKYHDRLKNPDRAKLHTQLSGFYKESDSPQMKADWNDFIAANIGKADANYDLGRKIVDYINDFENAISKLDDEEDDDIKTIAMLKGHLKKFLEAHPESLVASLQNTKQDYEKKARAKMCLDHGLSCPELVPDLDRFEKMLGSKKSQKRIEALVLLQKMPKQAGKLEDKIFEHLMEAKNGKMDQTNQLIKESAMALAAIPTSNKKILSSLVDMILSSRLSAQYIRDQLATGLEPHWLEALKSGQARNRMIILMELNEYSKLSNPTCEYMKVLEKGNSEYFIKDAAKRALNERCP